MKFRALVVAAMVITSVNAAGKGGLMGCLGGRCTSRSDSEQNLLGDEQGPAMPQDAAGNEQEPEVSQDPSNNESGESRFPEPTKKEQSGDLVVGKRDPACSGMAFSLGELQNKILGLAKSFEKQLPSLHVVTSEIMYWEAMYNRNIFQKYRKVKVGVKNTKKLSELSKEYGEAKANLKGTYRYLVHRSNSHRILWSVFIKQCDPTQYPKLIHPKGLTKEGNFLIQEIELPEDMRGTSSKWAFL